MAPVQVMCVSHKAIAVGTTQRLLILLRQSAGRRCCREEGLPVWEVLRRRVGTRPLQSALGAEAPQRLARLGPQGGPGLIEF
jgi:hypothetical protein